MTWPKDWLLGFMSLVKCFSALVAAPSFAKAPTRGGRSENSVSLRKILHSQFPNQPSALWNTFVYLETPNLYGALSLHMLYLNLSQVWQQWAPSYEAKLLEMVSSTVFDLLPQHHCDPLQLLRSVMDIIHTMFYKHLRLLKFKILQILNAIDSVKNPSIKGSLGPVESCLTLWFQP